MMLIDSIAAALEQSERPLRSREIADLIYAHDADGGPLTADSLVRNAIARAGRGRIVATGRGYVLLAMHRDTERSAEDRLSRALRLHRAGFDYRMIGERIGVSEKHACRLIRHARKARILRRQRRAA